jgi:hypothetical protein
MPLIHSQPPDSLSRANFWMDSTISMVLLKNMWRSFGANAMKEVQQYPISEDATTFKINILYVSVCQ